jgi:hypothetical protein
MPLMQGRPGGPDGWLSPASPSGGESSPPRAAAGRAGDVLTHIGWGGAVRSDQEALVVTYTDKPIALAG